jgi:hypothetical protein
MSIDFVELVPHIFHFSEKKCLSINHIFLLKEWHNNLAGNMKPALGIKI